MPPRRRQLLNLIPLLVGFVIGFDLLWILLASSNDSLAYGLLDEPARLAICAVALLLLAALWRRPMPAAFALAALLACAAIDLDHPSHYLGSEASMGTMSRPYTLSLLVAGLLVVAAALWPRSGGRLILAGLGLGVAAHLRRDLATGPGLSILWPVSKEIVRADYAAHAVGLLSAVGLAMASAAARPSGLPPMARRSSGLPLLALVAAGFALAASSPPTHAKVTVSTGAYIPGSDRDPSLIGHFAQQTGRSPALLSFYRSWGPPLIDPVALSAVAGNGSVPMLTWEPWDENEHGVWLWSIATGQEDRYIAESAREAAAWGGPILLRFAHEMNGNWYPWGWGNNGNTPVVFKAAWRRIVGIFRGYGATNVRWVWCPYVSNVRLRQFRRFYPGDRYVEWACLDGFNWGSYRSWQSFKEIFDLSYRALVRVTRRPIMIGETGVNQSGGNKPRWLTRTLRRVIPRYTHVRAIVWYSAADHRADFRVDSSPRSLAAFRDALRQPLYASDATRLLGTPSTLPPTEKKEKHPRRRGR